MNVKNCIITTQNFSKTKSIRMKHQLVITFGKLRRRQTNNMRNTNNYIFRCRNSHTIFK